MQIQIQIQGGSEVKFWHWANTKKILRKRPYLWNRLTYTASTPLKSKLLACPTRKTPQGVSSMPWEHRRAGGASFRGSQTHRNRFTLGPEPEHWPRQKSEFFVHFGSFRQKMPVALSKSCTGIPSERVSEVRLPRNARSPLKTPKLSCEASLNLRNGFSSKMNQNKR